MRFGEYTAFISLLLILAVLGGAAGCTMPRNSEVSASPPPATASSSGVITTTAVAKTANVDTSISVSFNDYSCLNVQDEMGVTYLYPDERYTLSATTPGPGTVNVNVLFVDMNDYLGLREIEPKWDSVGKKWVYSGIVPLAQFDDVNGPVQKTFTVKTQSKYYICVDDRKETGVRDTIYHVPVKLLKLP